MGETGYFLSRHNLLGRMGVVYLNCMNTSLLFTIYGTRGGAKPDRAIQQQFVKKKKL